MIIYYTHSNQRLALLAGVVAAMAAAWTKQPGIVWAGIVLPLVLFSKMMKERKVNWLEIIAILFSISAPLVWLLGVGNHF